jgi:Protein of unknown function (DUF2905)
LATTVVKGYTPDCMSQFGRMLVIGGLALVAVGMLLMLGERLGVGKIPGDLIWKRKNTTVYFPVVTSLIVSVILTVILNVILRRK